MAQTRASIYVASKLKRFRLWLKRYVYQEQVQEGETFDGSELQITEEVGYKSCSDMVTPIKKFNLKPRPQGPDRVSLTCCAMCPEKHVHEAKFTARYQLEILRFELKGLVCPNADSVALNETSDVLMVLS